MLLTYYKYGVFLVGGAIFASNLYFTDKKVSDQQAVYTAGIRAIRYGIPFPMTLLDLHSKYIKNENWMEIFKP